ncbi:hypothetical protein K435DRAFT_835582 [Dendrothele bispora CBS 962.96]|uniref:DUF6534 domain-containing protein n=1 Tax=Dendrothele bispora (strain CBS 962.96) TaxID=1314807 RepID=A0A4S8MMB3_DENBC|nr:hypothetical protein K435DRAFT_835582 [Dendrothele bispora CBS 962.96]
MPPLPTETWGCHWIAYVLDICLYGCSLLMLMWYFRVHSAHDSFSTKLTVGLIGIFSTAHVVLMSHQMYTDFIERFGEPDGLDVVIDTSGVDLLSGYLTSFIAQIFFATRIWRIAFKGKKILFTAPVVILALLQISAGIAQTTFFLRIGRYSQLGSTVRITSTQAAATALCDIFITIILCYLLHTSKTGIRNTNTVIDKLILYAINRGAATSLAALLNLILFVSIPNTFIFMIPLLPSCQLYVISVTSMLCSREGLRGKLYANSTDGTFPLSIIGTQTQTIPSFHVQNPSSMNQTQTERSDTVNVQHSMVTFTDAARNDDTETQTSRTEKK